MSVSVAIVGTGPAGFYTAEALLRKGLDCTIDLIDRLPTPYGLIRFGVAPDHQTTKKVTRNFEKTALNERCRFFGNVTLGRDVTCASVSGARGCARAAPPGSTTRIRNSTQRQAIDIGE